MRRAVWNSAAVLLLALVPACAVMAAIGGAVPTTVEILLPVGLLALTLAQLADSGRLRLPTLQHRFELGVVLALGQLLAAVAVGAAVMFVSPHDAWMTVAILLFAAVVATRAAQLLLRGVERDVGAIRAGLHALERGEREIEIEAHSGRELEDLAHTANRMVATLTAEERARDTADAARRQVIAAVSHDLRTPLSALRLLTEALEDELVDPATARRYVHTMGAHVRTLGTLDRRPLRARVPRRGRGGVEHRRRGPRRAGRRSVRAGAPRDRGRGRRAKRRAPAEPGRSRRQPRQAAAGTAEPAAERDPPHPPGRLGRDPGGSRRTATVEVEVADTGAGIAPQDRPHVFEPFYRGGDEAARTGPGSGLGLAIARAIIEAHGGRIWLAEAAGGTHVRFTLPAAAPAAARSLSRAG